MKTSDESEQTKPSERQIDLSPSRGIDYEVPKESEEEIGLRKFFDGLTVPEEGITE